MSPFLSPYNELDLVGGARDPALTDDLKIVLFEDAADISDGKDAEFTHGPLRSG